MKILKPIGSFLIAFVFFMAAMLLGGLVTNVLGDINVFIRFTLGVLVQIAVCTYGIFLAGKLERLSLQDYGIKWQKKDFPKLLLGLVIGIAVFLIVCAPLYLTGAYSLDSGDYAIGDVVLDFILFIAVGFTEEFLCRGFLLHRFLRFGPFKALAFAAAIFSLLHLANPGVTVLSLVNIFLAGIFIGSTMFATNSIYTAVGVHITWNWVQGAIMGIPVSGSKGSGYFITRIVGDNAVITGGAFGAEGSIYCTIFLTIFSLLLLGYAKKSNKLQHFQPII
ncbi:lysostaphin resistance A-like protein [Enterococcus sp. AZ109]|uniref:CPBP family intramembrane glutamic endopeptidase n=1 Tax=Enterococcus sp. AZ109 TaxID=2774634 RepID=UPI003F213A5D